MRNIIDIVEQMSPFASWKRWWGNTITGKLVKVDAGIEHDDFLCENVSMFLTPQEMKAAGINRRRPDESGSAVLKACYEKGWQAILYDGSDRSLMARGDRALPIRALRLIVNEIAGEIQVDRFFVDRVTINADGDEDVVSAKLEGEDLERFLKTGSIRRSAFR